MGSGGTGCACLPPIPPTPDISDVLRGLRPYSPCGALTRSGEDVVRHDPLSLKSSAHLVHRAAGDLRRIREMNAQQIPHLTSRRLPVVAQTHLDRHALTIRER